MSADDDNLPEYMRIRRAQEMAVPLVWLALLVLTALGGMCSLVSDKVYKGCHPHSGDASITDTVVEKG